jgi:AraC-like DNA-binding protein
MTMSHEESMAPIPEAISIAALGSVMGRAVHANHFDVTSIPLRDRADAIRTISQAVNGRIKVDLPPNPAHIKATMPTRSLDSVDISRIHWNVSALRRSAGPLRDDVEPQVFVGLQESGFSQVSQGGRTAELRPGDLILVETAKPYSIFFRGTIGLVTVRAPTQVLQLPPSVLSQVTALRLGPERPIANAAAAFLSRLARDQGGVSETDARLLMQPCVELIRAVATTGLGHDHSVREPLNRTLLQRVTAYVRLHLAEPDLNAARIAADHHVSVRQLYLTLARADISLGDWIRNQRLEECRRELALPRNRSQTIEEIAHRWGFTSASHFSRVFKAAYGASPGEWRNRSRQLCLEGEA